MEEIKALFLTFVGMGIAVLVIVECYNAALLRPLASLLGQ